MIINSMLINYTVDSRSKNGIYKKNALSNSTHYNTNFGSKVVKVIYGENNEMLNDKIDKFEQSKTNATQIGQGKFATVYRFNNTGEVIKSAYKTDIFTNEAKALSLLPKRLKNTQQLISYVKTEDGNYHLISTFQDGQVPHPDNVRWTNSHFHSLMDNIYKLDKSGINHMDLNRKNCLLESNGNVDFIDYQWAEPFNVLDKNPKMLRTKFELPSNILIFEKAGLTSYLAKTNDAEHRKETLKLYLQNKADFLERRRNYVLSQINTDSIPEETENAIKYDKICSKVYRNPSDEVVDLEAKKLQFLYSHRQISTLIDPNLEKDAQIITVPTLYLYTLESTKDFINSAKELENSSTDDTMKTYAKYQQEYGDIYMRRFKDWSCGTFEWILRNTKGEAYNPSDDLSFDMNKVNEKNITPKLKTILEKDYSSDLSGYGSTSHSFQVNHLSECDSDKSQLFLETARKQSMATDEGKNELALNYILQSMNLARIMKGNHNGYFCDYCYNDFMQEQTALARNIFKGEINNYV